VEFCFLQARKSIVATSALAFLLTCTVDSFPAMAQNAAQPAGQAPAGQAVAQPAAGQAGAAPAKNYKDRGEYDLYAKVTQTADPKARLEVLNTWQDKYPQTDFQQERLQYYVATLGQLAGSDATQRKPLLDKCAALLKIDPKNFTAAYYLSLWGPVVDASAPSADLESQIDSAAHVVLDNADAAFPAAKKPASMSDADWAKAKNGVIAIADNALAAEAMQKKDTATAENEYKASLQANPNQGRVSAAYGKLLIDDKKYPDGLFEYARAAEYDGAESVPAAQRATLLAYFNKAYSDFHGSPDGAQPILDQAKTSALPPDGFTIASANDLATKQADVMNQRIASDPAFKMWYAVKQNLQDKGDAFFTSDIKDVEIPGGAEGVKDFNGTVISLDPPDKPTKVVLGVEDPTKPDATLEFSQPLPPEALDKIKVGQKLDFSGVADSFTKDPYMLTFKDPTIPGVKTTVPPKTGHARRRR
jgi:hypothetical protein